MYCASIVALFHSISLRIPHHGWDDSCWAVLPSARVSRPGGAVRHARIEARDSIRLVLAERFSTTGEGASYGGPVIAADLLLARALPEIDTVLSTLDKDAQTELVEDLWENRANILARAAPTP